MLSATKHSTLPQIEALKVILQAEVAGSKERLQYQGDATGGMLIAFACFVLWSALAVRSLILAISESKGIAGRLFDLLLCLIFAACAILTFPFASSLIYERGLAALILFLAIWLPIMHTVRVRLRNLHVFNPALLIAKTLFLLLLICVSLATVMSVGFQNLTEDQPVLKITMTGSTRMAHVNWKPPNGTPQSQDLTEYEVVMETPDGKPVARTYLYGDQVAVKAKLLRFRPIVNALGIQNLAHIEFVFNGYTTAERHNMLPHHAETMHVSPAWIEPWQNRFWGYWDRVFREERSYWLVKSATIESTFFPLTDEHNMPFRGSYLLTVNAGGLSGLPVP